MSGLDPRALALVPVMTEWRHDFHAHPETAYAETRTAAKVAELLRAFGWEVTTGLAGTGLVGTLVGSGGDSRVVGLRADMDALPIGESPGRAHGSTQAGRSHACGHDGHMAMLLGAAKILAERRNDVPGTVRAIFQPAEETEAGAKRMIEDGLFDRFPVDQVFGLHNWPLLEAGRFALRAGPVMASCDLFEIVLTGKGTHGAMPHLGRDVLAAAAHLVAAAQTIVARDIDPLEPAVVSVTQMQGGDTWNALPETVTLRGTARAFAKDVQDRIEERLGALVEGLARAFAIKVDFRYERRYPPTVNEPEATRLALAAAEVVVGAAGVETDPKPSMGAEDFAFMLERRPGAYAWLGSGAPGQAMLHNAAYDFNDAVLAAGASYWLALVGRFFRR